MAEPSKSQPNNGQPDDGAGTRQLAPVAPKALAHRNPYGSPGGYGNTPDGEGPDLRQLLLQYAYLIFKRKWLILSVAGPLLMIGVVRTLMETPLYSASVRIQIDQEAAKIVEKGSIETAGGGEGESISGLRTQYEILKSTSMAERVASLTRAGEDLDLFKPRNFSLLSAVKKWLRSDPDADVSKIPAGTREKWAAGIIAGGISIRPVSTSRLVDIGYTDPSPERASRVANAYAEAYISQTIDKRFQANAYAKTFLDDKSKQLQLRLEESEKALLRFSEERQIIVLSEKSSIAENNLAAANTALSALISERIRNEQIWRQVDQEKAVDLPQFLQNPVIQALRASRKLLETEYQEKLSTFKPAYPAMVEITTKIKEIDRQLAAETKAIRNSLKGAYEASQRQEQETKVQIEKLRVEVLDLQKNLIEYNILKREADTNKSLYNGLLQRLREVEVAGGVGTNNVFIIDRAQTPGGPSSPDLSKAVMTWLALGLGAGLGAAYLLETLNDTIRTPEELEQVTGLPTLGIIPKGTLDGPAEEEVSDPRSALSEAYRSFATSLQFSTDQGLPRSLLITSAGPGEGKSLTALATARHFALMGMKVLLIDGDLRNPSLHNKLGLPNSFGLSNYLTGGCTPPETMLATDVANLAFIPTGVLPPNAADLLASPRLHSMLTLGLEVFDMIVIDGPPVLGLADAQLLSSIAAATVFIVGAGQTRAGAVRGALKRMDLARSPIIGAVLTKYDAKMSGYGYEYGYGYGYGSGKNQSPPGLENHAGSAGGRTPAATLPDRQA